MTEGMRAGYVGLAEPTRGLTVVRAGRRLRESTFLTYTLQILYRF